MGGRDIYRRLDALILLGADDKIVPGNPAIIMTLKRARWASYLFLIAFAAALILLGAADTVKV